MYISNINDEKSLSLIITRDFNVRSKNWWSQDITNGQVSIINSLTSTSVYRQLINLPIHVVNACFSCIDLISVQTKVSSQNLILKNLFLEIVATIVLLPSHSTICREIIISAKNDYMLSMSKLNDPYSSGFSIIKWYLVSPKSFIAVKLY